MSLQKAHVIASLASKSSKSDSPAPSSINICDYIFISPTKHKKNNESPPKNKNKMKLLTLNFLTCARKTCKASSASAAFPLHPKEAELEQIEIDLNPVFIKNMLPRLDWEAIKTLAQEVNPLTRLLKRGVHVR